MTARRTDEPDVISTSPSWNGRDSPKSITTEEGLFWMRGESSSRAYNKFSYSRVTWFHSKRTSDCTSASTQWNCPRVGFVWGNKWTSHMQRFIIYNKTVVFCLLIPVTSHLLDWWWWWRRRTASSWAPVTTPRSAPRSRRCSWCGPAGRPPSPWCSGGRSTSEESARCSGRARSAGCRRCCRSHPRRGSACRGRWRWDPCARRCPRASSSLG